MRTRNILAASIASLFLSTAVEAATFVWDGGDAASNLWSAANNWNPNGAPLVATTTDDIVFAGTVRLTPDLEANRTINSLTFNNTAGGFTLGSIGGFTLTTGAGGITQSDDNQQTITLAIALGAAQAWTNNGTAGLQVNGAVNLNGQTLTLVSNTGAVNITGAISGTGGLIKNGTFASTLGGSATNTFIGTTTVNAGSFNLSKTGGATAIPGDLIVGDGSGTDTVNVNASNQIADTSSVTVNGTFNLNSSSTETIGALIVNSGGSVNPGTGTLTIGSLQVNGSGSLVSSPGGFVDLNGNVTTTATAGSQAALSSFIRLNGAARTFTIGDDSQAFDATMGNWANGTLVKEGPGGLFIGGQGTLAAITLNAGLLAVSQTVGIGDSTLTLNGGTFQTTAASLNFTNAVNVGGSVTFAGSSSPAFSGPMTLGVAAPTFTITNSGITTFSGAIGQSISGAGFTKMGASVFRLGGSAPNTYTGTTTVTEGTLQLAKTSGVTAIPGDLVIGDGTGSDIVQFLASNQIADTSAVTINDSASIDLGGFSDTIGGLVLVTLNSAANLNSGSLTIGSGGLQIVGSTITGTGTLTLNGSLTSPASNLGIGLIFPAVSLGGGTRNFDIDDGAAAFEVDLSGVVSNGSILKRGSGTLRLSGTAANTFDSLSIGEGVVLLNKTAGLTAFAGNAAVGDGSGAANSAVLRLLASNQLPEGVGISITVNDDGRLDLNGFSDTISGLSLTGGSVTTGAGTLMLGSDGVLVSSASASAATISGNLNLGGANKSFSIADGGLAIDVDISALVSNGAITKSGDGRLRLTGANTFAGGLIANAGTVLLGSASAHGGGTISLSGGALEADGAARTVSNALVVTAPSVIRGALNLTFDGSVSIQATGSITKSGSGTLTFGAGVADLAGSITLDGGALTFTVPKTLKVTGVFTQNAGTTFNGTLINQGTFLYNGGIFNGTLQNDSSAFFNAPFVAATGFTNSSTIFIGSTASLSANGTGIVNDGTISISAGTLQATGSGVVVNNGEINGSGTIAGGAGFTNNAQLTVNGGNLTLANTGTNTNAGNIDVPAGHQFRLNNPMTNTGTVVLAGGSVASTATLTNSAGGTVRGRGVVSTPFSNAGGTLRPEGGTLNITNALTNSGLIDLIDGAGLSGGAITNTGRIEGDGTIASAVTNTGRIEPRGTLTFGGTVTASAGGIIAASSGNTAFFSTGLATNAGAISLSGGTLDNNGFALNNTGTISGFGTIFTGGAGLTNNGSVTFTGGFTSVHGSVTNAATRKIEVIDSAAIFHGNVVNNGTFKNTGATITFVGSYTENGTFNSDPADNFFSDLIIGPGGTLIGGEGDRFFVSGLFNNMSLLGLAWDTSAAELIFTGAGAHTFTLAGADLGATPGAFSDNFAWGTLHLTTGAGLTLGDGNATPGAALYASVIQLDGGLPQIASITGNGINIYYDPLLAGNAYLGDTIHPLANGGALVPVPEPGSMSLLFAAVPLLGLRRFRR